MGGTRGTIITFVVIAASAIALLATLAWLPPFLIGDTGKLSAKDALDAQSDLRGTVISALGGVLVLGGLIFTARTFLSTREGQVTDRYTAAVNQLGSDKAQVRLGGIYALERIARDSKADRSTIIEILAAVVREVGHAADRATRLPEIEAALTVLSRLPGAGDARSLDLRDAGLAGIRVAKLAMRGANLTSADLANAQLPDADLRGATLDYVTATEARLSDAKLQGASGTGAIFIGAVLERADLSGSQFPGASFTRTRMAAATLNEANLAGAHFPDALLTRGKDGKAVRAARADFTNADLERTTLEGVDLRTAQGLTRAQRDIAYADTATRWPAAAT
jgi:uncharacterized protein YjbI with pentapeptide repeats